MTDEEYIYISTNRERKIESRSAKYKKNGSKSKKCTTSFDRMSIKERKKLNGEVQKISKNDKLSYKEFKKLPISLRHEYIEMLVNNYGARQTDIAKMMGVCKTTLCTHLSESGIKGINWSASHKPTEAWIRFCEGEDTLKPNLDEEGVSTVDVIEDKTIKESKNEDIRANNITTYSLESGTLTFNGTSAIILEQMYKFLDGQRKYKMTIAFEVIE